MSGRRGRGEGESEKRTGRLSHRDERVRRPRTARRTEHSIQPDRDEPDDAHEEHRNLAQRALFLPRPLLRRIRHPHPSQEGPRRPERADLDEETPGIVPRLLGDERRNAPDELRLDISALLAALAQSRRGDERGRSDEAVGTSEGLASSEASLDRSSSAAASARRLVGVRLSVADSPSLGASDRLSSTDSTLLILGLAVGSGGVKGGGGRVRGRVEGGGVGLVPGLTVVARTAWWRSIRVGHGRRREGGTREERSVGRR